MILFGIILSILVTISLSMRYLMIWKVLRFNSYKTDVIQETANQKWMSLILFHTVDAVAIFNLFNTSSVSDIYIYTMYVCMYIFLILTSHALMTNH